MKDFKIVISKTDIYVSDNSCGMITTPFCIQVAESYFPCSGWQDFTCEVLSMWTEELLRNKDRRNAIYTLYFMDGPHRLEVKQDNSILMILGVSERKGSLIRFSYSCTYTDFLLELLYAFRQLKRAIIECEDICNWVGHSSILNTIDYYVMKIGSVQSTG